VGHEIKKGNMPKKQKGINKRQLGYIIGGFAIFLLGGVVYAATQGTLTFTGEVTRQADINLNITQPTCDPLGDAYDCNAEVTLSGHLMAFSIDFARPGDTQNVSFCIENVGTIDADTLSLTQVIAPGNGITVTPPANVSNLTIVAGDEVCQDGFSNPFVFQVEWDSAATADTGAVTFSYALNYVQTGQAWSP
jgi:hypothetical protein